MTTQVIDKKISAIVMFGPATPTSGFRPAEYYQVVIDPNMQSPKGDFIRFDSQIQGGEIHGWQRIEALTICEILGDAPEYSKIPDGYSEQPGASVCMKVVSEGG